MAVRTGLAIGAPPVKLHRSTTEGSVALASKPTITLCLRDASFACAMSAPLAEMIARDRGWSSTGNDGRRA